MNNIYLFPRKHLFQLPLIPFIPLIPALPSDMIQVKNRNAGGGRGSMLVGGAVMWLGRGRKARKSVFPPISHHPKFRVTDLPS